MDRAPLKETGSAPTSFTSTPNPVVILGAGPAGSIAAIQAQREGAKVQLIERCSFPKHKVCGEFFSPEILPILDRAGVLDRFLLTGLSRLQPGVRLRILGIDTHSLGKGDDRAVKHFRGLTLDLRFLAHLDSIAKQLTILVAITS